MSGFFITATDTGVGKTVASTLLTYGLKKRGIQALHFKPVQSGIIVQNGHAFPPDLLFSFPYLKETGESVKTYCARRNVYTFETPVSPDLSAQLAGASIDPEKIILTCAQLASEYTVIAEGAGGVFVPLASGYYVYSLAVGTRLPIIVVARSSLGTINHTALTLAFLAQQNLRVAGIVFSRYCGTAQEDHSIARILEITHAPLLGTIPAFDVDTESTELPEEELISRLSDTSFDWDKILSFPSLREN